MNNENQNYFGVRLKLARKMAGFSLQELSDKLDNLVSKQALNKYEQGLIKPSNDVLLGLSKSLNLKPDYFLKKKVLEISNISFRKRLMPKKLEESIIEKSRDYVERFFELENILGKVSDFKNPLQVKSIVNFVDTESAANELRDAWKLGNDPISNLVELLELHGVKVILLDEIDEFDGVSYNTSNLTPVLTINTRSRSIERIRFTLIHELAHLLLSFDKKKQSDKDIEVLCHNFSSCFLIPSEKLIEMIGGSHRNYININELILIKEYFGISIRAIVHRLRGLNVISPNYYQRWMIYMSKTYGQKGEPGVYKGDEKARLFEQLINRALSEELITMSKAAFLMNTSISKIRRDAPGEI